MRIIEEYAIRDLRLQLEEHEGETVVQAIVNPTPALPALPIIQNEKLEQINDALVALDNEVTKLKKRPTPGPFDDRPIVAEINSMRMELDGHQHPLSPHGHEALDIHLNALQAAAKANAERAEDQDWAIDSLRNNLRDIEVRLAGIIASIDTLAASIKSTMAQASKEHDTSLAALESRLMGRIVLPHVHDTYLSTLPTHSHHEYAESKDLMAHLEDVKNSRRLVKHQSTEETRGKERWILEEV